MSAGQLRLSVGDPQRLIIGRAVRLTLVAAAVFSAFAYVAKEVPSLYLHEPWQSDPYDTLVSFSIVFVPLVAMVNFLRIPLCRKDRELPLQRVRDLIRGCRLIVGIALATVLADWVSVAFRVDRSAWNPSTTLTIALLLITTGGVGLAAFGVMRVSFSGQGGELDPHPVDGLGDAVLVARHLATHLGPAARLSIDLLEWVDVHVLSRLRSHPLLAAAMISVTFGVAAASGQAIGEGIQKWLLLLFFFSVAACAMFAFVVIGGAHLGLMRSRRPAQGFKRRTIDATVAAAAVVPLCVAFRTILGDVLGTNVDSSRQIGVLLVGAAAVIFVVALLAETVAGAHEGEESNPKRRRHRLS